MAKQTGFIYIKDKPRKRPGRHAKSYNKRTSNRKTNRGQG